MSTFYFGYLSAWQRAGLVMVAAALAGLAGCGGSSYGGGGGNNPVNAAPSKLFAADSTDMAVGSLANRNPAAGSLTPDRVIAGPIYVALSTNIGSLALDAVKDRLYVGNGT